MSFSRFSGLDRMRTAPAWAIASVRIEAGRTGLPPGPAMKYLSSEATFLTPRTRRSSSISRIRSTRRNGYRCGSTFLMSSISRGRTRGAAGIRRVYPGRHATMPRLPASDATSRAAPPGQLLAELLPIVGELSAVLDPEELMPAIARALRRVLDYRILDIFRPEADGTLVPVFVEGYDRALAGRLRIRPGEGI